MWTLTIYREYLDPKSLSSLQNHLDVIDHSIYNNISEVNLFGISDDQRAFVENERRHRSTLKSTAETVLVELQSTNSSFSKIAEYGGVQVFRKTAYLEGILALKILFEVELPLIAVLDYFLDSRK